MSLPAALGNVSFINSILSSASVSLGSLAQILPSGSSPPGTIIAKSLPRYLGGPDPSNDASDYPWGNALVTTNPVESPSTGVTRSYDLTIARCTIAPDGVQKDGICVNGQFPGPMLEANWGDMFHITVHNNLSNPEDGTSIHWHGFTQKGTPEYDGVPGISQCPIAPGSSLVYEFQADSYGSSWYHSHYTAQYTDGCYGPMVVYGPTSEPYDVDFGPVLVSDWYHDNSKILVERAMSSNLLVSQTVFADGSLINGRMDFDCDDVAEGTPCKPNAGLAKFLFKPGKKHLLRFTNPSTFAVILVSIDHHTMSVIANDFVPIVPYDTTVLNLAAGQRADVIVTANPSPPTPNGAYWIRTRQPTLCALAYQPFALAVIYYAGNIFGTSGIPISLPQPDFLVPRLLDCGNDDLSLTEPSYAIKPLEPDVVTVVQVTTSTNGSGQSLYYMNGETFHSDYDRPVLRGVQDGQTSFAKGLNLYDFGNNKSIRLIFNNETPFSHPIHVHGQNMFVLSSGTGTWDGVSITRPENPQRRDTHTLVPLGYMVFQLSSDNPGVWPIHCHFSWHVSAGLIINVVQRKDEVKDIDNIAPTIKQSCDPWYNWQSTHVVDEIDSGV